MAPYATGNGGIGKTEFVQQLAERTGFPKATVQTFLDQTIDIITETVSKGQAVNITGFGKFEPRARSARSGRNPKTGEPLQIEASVAPGFSAGKAFKDAVKNANPKVAP